MVHACRVRAPRQNTNAQSGPFRLNGHRPLCEQVDYEPDFQAEHQSPHHLVILPDKTIAAHQSCRACRHSGFQQPLPQPDDRHPISNHVWQIHQCQHRPDSGRTWPVRHIPNQYRHQAGVPRSKPAFQLEHILAGQMG